MPRQGSRTRERLLDAAFDEVHRKGFQGTSLDEILARTGVTKGALYHHFPSKQDLGYALVDERLAKALISMLLLPPGSEDDPLGALVAAIRGAARGLSEESVCLGCPIGNLAQEMSPVDEGFRKRVAGLYRLWQDTLARFLEAGREAGHVRRDVDASAAASFVVASLAGARLLAKNARDREVLRRCIGELAGYLEGLRPPPRRRAPRK